MQISNHEFSFEFIHFIYLFRAYSNFLTRETIGFLIFIQQPLKNQS